MGAEDDRYLWPHMLRAIREIRPDWVIGENVGGILTMVQPGKAARVGSRPSLFGEADPVYRKREEYVVETICGNLEREGYTVQPLLIPACAVGAPHRRDRVWFVAHRDGAGLQGEGTEQRAEGAAGNYPREAAAHPRGDGDTPPRTGAPVEADGIHVDARRGRGWEEPQRADGLPGLPRAAADPGGKGLEGSADAGELRTEREGPDAGQPARFLCPYWEEFPTQSPVCGGDDGLPRELDGISFSMWRQQSVKGYGNAIVPQVIHEIFKAIELTYKEK